MNTENPLDNQEFDEYDLSPIDREIQEQFDQIQNQLGSEKVKKNDSQQSPTFNKGSNSKSSGKKRVQSSASSNKNKQMRSPGERNQV